MAENKKELALGKAGRVSSWHRQDVLLVLDLDETVILANCRQTAKNMSLSIDKNTVKFSEVFDLDMHDCENEQSYPVRILNPAKIASLISFACEQYGGVAFCTAGAWSAKTTGQKLAKALRQHLSQAVYLRLQKAFISNPLTDIELFPNVSDVKELALSSKAIRAEAWSSKYEHLQKKSLVLFDNDINHVQAFQEHISGRFSGVVCDVVEREKQVGCCYTNARYALFRAACDRYKQRATNSLFKTLQPRSAEVENLSLPALI